MVTGLSTTLVNLKSTHVVDFFQILRWKNFVFHRKARGARGRLPRRHDTPDKAP